MAPTVKADELVTGILSTYEGFWQSYEGAVSPIEPDSSHDMLDFQQNGVIYSTGVNDSILDAQAISFVPSVYRALRPVDLFSSNVGQGAWDDGSSTSASLLYPTPGGSILEYLTDGVNGLNLSTFGNNVGTVANFNLTGINIAVLNDPAPEFVYFNNAAPSGGGIEFKLCDMNDNQLGTTAQSIENQHLDIANIVNDRIRTDTGAARQLNQNIRLQGFTLAFTDFNITAAELATAVRMELTLTDAADPPFVAYNATSLTACAVGDADNDGLCDSTEGSGDADGDGLDDAVALAPVTADDSDGDGIPDLAYRY